jgi:cation diffusion facilitator family transporter
LAETIQRIDTEPLDTNLRRLYVEAGLVAIVGNVLLLAAKGAVAYFTGSSAIYADAANSASDVAYSVLMLTGLWLSLRPADASHPHGHRRIETLVSLIISLMMILAGIEAARSGYTTWRAGNQPITSILALIVPVFTIVVKGAMFATVRRLGHRSGSRALMASASDNLYDMVSSGTALAGVLANRFLFPAADSVAAVLVALWILRGAWGVLQQSIQELIGGAAPEALSDQIEQVVRSVPGVIDVHQVILEYVGPQVRADIHIDMPADATLAQVHAVSDSVRAAVEAIREVDHAFIHVEPLDPPAA